jgi:hypothetical protein
MKPKSEGECSSIPTKSLDLGANQVTDSVLSHVTGLAIKIQTLRPFPTRLLVSVTIYGGTLSEYRDFENCLFEDIP